LRGNFSCQTPLPCSILRRNVIPARRSRALLVSY
jgi:hypothetical protein